MKYYKNGNISVDSGKPEEITMEIALQEIDKLPDEEEMDDNFIGFINEKKETIQFIRREQDNWFMDVPVLQNGKFSHSLQDDDLTTEMVRDVTKRFFLGEDWKSLCNLKTVSRPF